MDVESSSKDSSSNRKRILVTEVKVPNENKRKVAQQQRERNQARRNDYQTGNCAKDSLKSKSTSKNPNKLSVTYKRSPPKYIDDRLKWTIWYADDIYEYWKSVELSRPLFDLSNEFFTWRFNQIMALKYLVKKFQFTNLTLHLAIHILDTFLSNNRVIKDERKLCIIACFIMAAKVEEDELKIPTLAQLNSALLKFKNGRFYSLEEYEIYEVKILRSTKFKLTIPTVATFANFLSRTTVSMEDFVSFNEQATALAARGYSSIAGLFNNLDHMLSTVNTLLFHLVDMSADITFLRNTLPSQMAAACVYAARRLTNVSPAWSITLENLTQYDETDMIPIAKPIIDVYTRQLII